MVWDPTQPPTDADLLSAVVRDNFAALGDGVCMNATARAQTVPNLTVLVAPFEYLTTFGRRGSWPGGTSPALTAPSTNPRISTLVFYWEIPGPYWNHGAEAATPLPPGLPSVLPLIEVFCRPGMTAIYDTDQGSHGYILRAAPRVPPLVLERRLLSQVGNPIRTIGPTAAETSIFASGAPIVPGGSLGGTGSFRLDVLGDLLQNSGAAGGATWRVKYGATTLATFVGITLTANAARRRWRLTLQVSARFQNNRQIAVGSLEVSPPEADGAGSDSAATIRTAGTAAAQVDSTVDQTLDVTVQPSASHASLTILPYSFLVTLI